MTVGLLKLKIDGIQYEFYINSNGQAIATLEKVAATLGLLGGNPNDRGSAKSTLFKSADEVRGLIKSRTSTINHKEIAKLIKIDEETL